MNEYQCTVLNTGYFPPDGSTPLLMSRFWHEETGGLASRSAIAPMTTPPQIKKIGSVAVTAAVARYFVLCDHDDALSEDRDYILP